MTLQILCEPHPWLDAACFETTFSANLEELGARAEITELFGVDVGAPFERSEQVRASVRDLLRHGGFRPSGRNKPASEYLVKAVESGRFGPNSGINLAVDACNAVSLHSGLPASVIDLDRVDGELSIKLCPEGTSYVFNASGQTIDVSGLISLWDESGPCANPVKDAQRTKTSGQTTRTLSIIWGTQALPGRVEEVLEWYRELLGEQGAQTKLCSVIERSG